LNKLLRIKHIAIVVKSIKKYLENSIYGLDQKITYDEHQDADICFVKTENVEMELLEPKSEKALAFKFLAQNGEGLHHICFEVDDMHHAEELIRARKMLKLPAAQGAKGVFAYTRNHELIEFSLKT